MNNNRTFQELQEAIKTEMQLDPGLISDNERKVFINNCLKELGRISLFEKMTTLTITDGVVTLPDDFVELIEIRYDKHKLTPSPMQSMDVSDNAPVYFAMTYNTVQLYPRTRTGTVTLYYVYRIGTLTLPEDKPDLPNGWDNLIVDYAVGLAHRKNGNIGLYREYMGAYNSGRGELIAELSRRANTRIRETIDNTVTDSPTFFEVIS